VGTGIAAAGLHRAHPGVRLTVVALRSVVELTDRDLAVALAPALGGKITSLRAAGHEWLTQAAPGTLRAYAPGVGFADADMSGWDEMLPTIVPCDDPTAPGTGRRLPDHGDLWDQPWEIVAQDARHVTLRARSRALPLVLTRRLELDAGRMRLDYEIRNDSEDALPYLWAAHPQFRCGPGTRVVLPEHIASVVNAQDDRHGEHGEVVGWPRHRGLDLDLVRDAEQQTCRKLYVLPEQRAGWAELIDPCGRSLRLEWDSGALPYLGVWIDEGRYSREPVCALEPCTGFFDSLAAAVDAGQCLSVGPAETRRWALDVLVRG
jgi:galactose mutarotase-like enzyme